MGYVVYIYKLDKATTEAQVRRVFESFGTVQHVLFNSGSSWPRLAKEIYDDAGYGAFVQYADFWSVDLAVKACHNTKYGSLSFPLKRF